MELSKFVGSRIRECRKNAKLTQKELGDQVGVKHNTISDYERGITSPEQDTLFAISKALNVSIDSFFPAQDDILQSFETELKGNEFKLNDLVFLQKVVAQLQSLEGVERDKFLDAIRFAVEFYNKPNK